MASLTMSFHKSFRKIVISSRNWNPLRCQVRYTRYDSSHMEATLDPEELSKPLAHDDPRKYRPIKAATNDQTTSVNYDPLVARVIRTLLKEGNKERARLLLDNTFASIKFIQLEKYHKAAGREDQTDIVTDPKEVLHRAVENCTPLLRLQQVKRGGVLYQVPIPVSENYAKFMAINWLIDSANDKDEDMRFWNQFANVLLNASKNEGSSVRKKQELHKVCEANRAYAHYRW